MVGAALRPPPTRLLLRVVFIVCIIYSFQSLSSSFDVDRRGSMEEIDFAFNPDIPTNTTMAVDHRGMKEIDSAFNADMSTNTMSLNSSGEDGNIALMTGAGRKECDKNPDTTLLFGDDGKTGQTTEKCGPASVAIMVSGQFARFIYKDQNGPLVKIPPSGCPPPIVDVYIALHKGNTTAPRFGGLGLAPYLKNPDMRNIEEWYRERGANQVVIRIVDDEHMDGVECTLRRHAMANNTFDFAPKKYKNKQDIITTTIAEFPRRWHSNLRMLYMRHLVYTLTLDRTYKAYLSLRDDNYFVEPLDLTRFDFGKYEGTNPSPYVIVDKYCSFEGAHSDKIHVTNKHGATLLFDTTWMDFVSKIVRWALYGYIRAKTFTHKDPFQTESFLRHVLSAGAVEEADLQRIDARYDKKNRLCCQRMYINKCTSNSTYEELRARNIKSCARA